MKRYLWLAPAVALSLVMRSPLAHAASPPIRPACDTRAILRAARTAAGGDRWDTVGELSADGSVTALGLDGRALIRDDVVDGRNLHRFDIAAMGTMERVYDGRTMWVQDISGGVHPLDSTFARQDAVTAAYLARRGYFKPSDGVRLRCLGTHLQNGRRLQIVRVTPPGGRPADLGIDPSTHLLVSVAERRSITTSLTTYADYRQDKGLVLPFLISSGTLFEPADGFVMHVRTYRISASVKANDFVKPQPTDVVRMLNGAHATTVPIVLDRQQLLVWASIDGHAPMPFILDTGGHAILTTGAAQKLGLRGYGAGVSGGSGAGTIATAYARVASMRIGDAELRNQHFLVINYPPSFYARGRRAPLAGILGLEIFERFAVRIDYGGRRLTLTPSSTFRYNGKGARVPLTFEGDTPLAAGAVDGHSGTFGVDTGNSGMLILYGHWLARTSLRARYPHGIAAKGFGTGGSDSGYIRRIRTFSFGGRKFHNVAAMFTNMKSGAFSSFTEAGDLGYDVLSRFIPTFDYANQTLYLAPR